MILTETPRLDPDRIISEVLPMMRGYILNRYRWVEEGQRNCLVTIDDLVQVSSIVLLKVARKWKAPAGLGEDEQWKVFWGALRLEVKHAVSVYLRNSTHYYDEAYQARFDEPPLEGEHENRFSVRMSKRYARGQAPALLQNELVDYFQRLPKRDKVYLALRYFDELPFTQMADVLSATRKTTENLNGLIVKRMRIHATNLVSSSPQEMLGKRVVPWSAPVTLLEYIRDRHQKDLDEYLGFVTVCMRLDVSYLTEMIGSQKTYVPTSHIGMAGSLTLDERREIDERISAGEVHWRIAADYGVSNGTIHRLAHQRAV